MNPTLKNVLAVIVGLIVGGVENFRELPNSPTWFIVVDLLLAYLPMGYLGGKLMAQKKYIHSMSK